LPTEGLTGHQRWGAPGFAPFRQRLAAFAPLVGADRLDALNAAAGEAGLLSGSGRVLRFVAQPSPSVSGRVASTSQALSGSSERGLLPDDLSAYEARIFDTGEVPTRISGQGERHDLYNAIVWLTFPLAKARLNALQTDRQRSSRDRLAPSKPSESSESSELNRPQAGRAAHGAGSQRGPLRDAATLFDENAAIWIGLDASFEAALRAFDWQDLFMRRRAQLSESVRLMVFGHALLEKLESPYKAVTAHAWPLRLSIDASVAEIDRALSLALDADRLNTRALCPLPVMGFPGWCAANADPSFYDDLAVFRSGRRGDKLPPDSVALLATG
jgi:hypothetical protein